MNSKKPTKHSKRHTVSQASTVEPPFSGSPAASLQPPAPKEGWIGWDQYAPFYDWENARTLGRTDVPFWQKVAKSVRGPILELGCGTGRIAIPLARAGVTLVGIDRSTPMLERAARRAARMRSRRRRGHGLTLVRGDIRTLPFASGAFAMVLAPYGVLQSLLRDRDLQQTLAAAHDVLEPGGVLGIDMVPDVPNWKEYRNRVQLRGRTSGGAHLTLVESVRQDPRRRLTIFEQRYLHRRGGHTTVHRFELTFRTLTVRQLAGRIERSGFEIDAVLGDYRGRPWDERADTWLILARKRA